MGSGSGKDDEDPRDVIEAFLVDARDALRREELNVQELADGTPSAKIALTTGFLFTFRGTKVLVNTRQSDIMIDGESVGGVVDGGLFDELKNDCLERHVFQQAEAEEKRKEQLEEADLARRKKRLGPLAARLRCGRARKQKKPLKKKK